ncbi:MAG: 5-dehydro-2-deoxygluconokinase [Anaerolineae bacterium]|nr:5-dehydro-2-deoxygluconokinase [Anaerolineae bacterium]
MGRSSIDLYANDVGAPFVDIESFAAYVGGCPTNISTGTRRLGLRSALLTGIGEDPVGDFLLNFLNKEGVETRYIVRKPGHRTSAVVLGIEPPDKFPLVYYRDNCADIELTIDDVLAAPVTDSRALLISGTGLSKEPSRSATLFAAELARSAGAAVYLDIDFRPDQWRDLRAFGVVIRSALRLVDVAIGSEDEVKAATLTEPSQVTVTHLQVSDAKVEGDLGQAVARLLGGGPEALVVKRGQQGCETHLKSGEVVHSPAFPVEIYNILGAGDAFASGLIYGRLKGWDWYKAGRMGNACGAIVVTKHGCANFMPTLNEVTIFIEEKGGF